MNMRTALSAWVDRTFGPIHVQDMFELNEQVGATKEAGIYLRNIVVALRKSEGFKKDWTSEETFARWKQELREIIGDDLIKFDLKSAEGSELNYIAGTAGSGKDAEKLVDAGGRLFTYRFTLSVIKRVRKSGG